MDELAPSAGRQRCRESDRRRLTVHTHTHTQRRGASHQRSVGEVNEEMKSGKKRVRGSKCIGGNVQKNLFFLSALPDHLHHFLLLFLFSACFLSFYHITQFLLFHLCRRKSREKMSLPFPSLPTKEKKKKMEKYKIVGLIQLFGHTASLSLFFFLSVSLLSFPWLPFH